MTDPFQRANALLAELAIDSYETFLAFFSDPEPGPAADAAADARRELEDLGRRDR